MALLKLVCLLPGLPRRIPVLAFHLRAGVPVRIGESAVASTFLHILRAGNPGTVEVLVEADAGRLLYGRRQPGAIVHLDVFHAPGEVRHETVARYVHEAISSYAVDFAGDPAPPPLPPALHAWADNIDIQTATGGGRASGGLTSGQKPFLRRSHRNHVHLALRLPPGAEGLLFYLVACVERAVFACGLDIRKVERLKTVRGVPPPESLHPYRGASDSMLGEEDSAPTGPAPTGPAPTGPAPTGYAANGAAIGPWFGRVRLGFRGRLAENRTGRLRRVLPYAAVRSSGLFDGIAPAETVAAALIRRCREGREGCEGREGRLAPAVGKDELMVWRRRDPHALDLCLVVDASASMSGRRMRAAVGLAGRLVRITRDRVAVISFQGTRAEVRVPFTRNRALLRQRLAGIVPSGLTPLAQALARARTYVASAARRRTLTVVITDGVATAGIGASDPLGDALAEAGRLARRRQRVTFIGLQPHEGFLRRLAAAAAGSVHVVSELDEGHMLAIALRERRVRNG